ncbi:hypothetical protein ACIRON_25235 [Nocardioides sp. NPDC101246]|uniref:hypothetical protein n=1 Tax=Nocardioides sp. NPDC101246 TaxID=3364336 RepID=UPI00381E4DD5
MSGKYDNRTFKVREYTGMGTGNTRLVHAAMVKAVKPMHSGLSAISLTNGDTVISHDSVRQIKALMRNA